MFSDKQNAIFIVLYFQKYAIQCDPGLSNILSARFFELNTFS